MESASFAQPTSIVPGDQPGAKGLKSNAIGYVSNLVIAVASTAPAYSLAVTLGLIVAVAGVGVQAPAILIVSFLPMLLIALAYRYLNRADPDCGTTFAWGTRALGPQAGWMGGWAIIVADIVVMASLAQIAGKYTFLLFRWDSAANSVGAVTAVGVAWILLMTLICYVGIELNARTQKVLLSFEVGILAIFAVIALVDVYANNPPGSIHVHASWFSPFAIHSFNGLVDGVLIGLFIYWGWDSGVAVNEESRDSATAPGKAAVMSTIALVLIYVVVATAAQAYAGTAALSNNSGDVLAFLGGKVFTRPFDLLLIIAVLTSAAASTQTTILPTARTSLSMADWGAIPKIFGRMHPRFQTPGVSTWVMGIVSAIWFVVVVNASTNVLGDSATALGFMIAFYYGLTGIACAVYYRHELRKSWRNFVFVGLLPFVGGLILFAIAVKAGITYGHQANNLSPDVFGVGLIDVIGIGGLLLGIVVMLFAWRAYPAFFKRRLEVADPAVLAGSAGEGPPASLAPPPPAPPPAAPATG